MAGPPASPGLPALIAGLRRDGDAWRGDVPAGWLQGRTAYGGLSSALALHAAQGCAPDLPPLRSAQVAFVGPLAGAIAIRATLLRRGRNAAWVQADVSGAAGLGLRAVFLFMAAMPSALDHRPPRAAPAAPPGPGDRIVGGNPAVAFTDNFAFVEPPVATGDAEWLRWVRLNDRAGLDPAVELVAVADCLPPAALKLVGRTAPVSSLTWQLNLLGPAPRSDDGWWLLRAGSHYAHAGSSSQAMHVWDRAGVAVAEHVQSVALFG